MRRIAWILALALAGCESISKDELAELDYGPRPVNWRKSIDDYLRPKLPGKGVTAQITFATEPKAWVQRETMMRDRHWGWAICVYIYDNHPEGAEDPYASVYYFRGEKMVFVNGGPGDKNPIGAGYARVQCRELGAPPLPAAPPRPEKPAAARPAEPRQETSPFPR